MMLRFKQISLCRMRQQGVARIFSSSFQSQDIRHPILLPSQTDSVSHFVKGSVFDDPIATKVIAETSTETYLVFKAAFAELQTERAARCNQNHIMRDSDLVNTDTLRHSPENTRFENARKRLLPTLTLLATNNRDDAMLKSAAMLPVIALNVTVPLHPPYVVRKLLLSLIKILFCWYSKTRNVSDCCSFRSSIC